MGFLSGLVGGVLGGGQQSKSSASYGSGFSMLPKEITDAYKNYGSAINAQIPNLTAAYTPLGQTGDETEAFNRIRQGFAPTEDSIRSDVSMLMNPFDDFVLGDVNRAAGSDYSILKQDLNSAGQLGSNRQRLGANDIEQTRLGTIGKLRQGQYNTALDQVLNNIIPQRQNDAQGLLGIGNFQRDLAGQTSQAPITGLQQLASALGILPTNASPVQTGSKSTSGGSLGSFLGNAGSIVSGLGSLSGFLSDRSLKENIVPYGTENGFNTYEYNYIWSPQKYIGVMADEVETVCPEAVRELILGCKVVDYGMIGVELRRVEWDCSIH